jgi:uncharacterized protein YllA (UPF0747 family)
VVREAGAQEKESEIIMQITPEELAKLMAQVAKNAPQVKRLRVKMKDEKATLIEKSLSFTECFMLLVNDPFAQKRLVLEFEAEVLRLRNAEAGL